MLGELVGPVASLFPLEELKARGSSFHMILHWPGRGQCGQCVASSLLLLIQSVLVSVVQGLLQPHSHVLGVCQWYLVLE